MARMLLHSFCSTPPVVDKLAFKVADWRSLSGSHVNAWLDALGHSKPCTAWLRFRLNIRLHIPDIIETGRSFEAVQLGHPLILQTNALQ